MEPILGQIALLPQLNETEELRLVSAGVVSQAANEVSIRARSIAASVLFMSIYLFYSFPFYNSTLL